MNAIWPQVSSAIACAERGACAISAANFAARRSCMAKRSSISAACPVKASPWPGNTVPAAIARVWSIDAM